MTRSSRFARIIDAVPNAEDGAALTALFPHGVTDGQKAYRVDLGQFVRWDGSIWSSITSFNQYTGYAVDVALQAGNDWGEKLQTAHDALPATGGILDCRGLDGSQTLDTQVDITTPGVTVLAGLSDIVASQPITVAPSAQNFALLGQGAWSGGPDPGPYYGTSFRYTGAGDFLQIGTTAADLYYVRLADLMIELKDAGAAARALKMARSKLFVFDRVVFYGNPAASGTTQRCVRLDGSVGVSGPGVFRDCVMLSKGDRVFEMVGSGLTPFMSVGLEGGWISGYGTSTDVIVVEAGTGFFIRNSYMPDATGKAIWLKGGGHADIRYHNANASPNDVVIDSGANYNLVRVCGSGGLTITNAGLGNVINGPTHLADEQRLGDWYLDNVAAAQTDVALTKVGGAGSWSTKMVMGRPGSITSIGVKSNAARAAGTLTVALWKNGSYASESESLDAIDTTFASHGMDIGTRTFVAGDEIELRITTDAGWLPTTADIIAWIDGVYAT